MIVNIPAHAYDQTVRGRRTRSGSFPSEPAQITQISLKDQVSKYYGSLTVDRFVVEMDEAGVDKAVILPVDVERTLNFVTSDEHAYLVRWFC